jgi:hypothetical protein
MYKEDPYLSFPCHILSYVFSFIFLFYLDPGDRREAELLHIIPKNKQQTFDMRRLIQLVIDKDSFFEIGGNWGKNMIVGFGLLIGFRYISPHLS